MKKKNQQLFSKNKTDHDAEQEQAQRSAIASFVDLN